MVEQKELPMNDRDARNFGYEGSWINGWGDNPPETVEKCLHNWNSKGKGKRSRDLNSRGTLSIVLCDVCKYYYMIDSGD